MKKMLLLGLTSFFIQPAYTYAQERLAPPMPTLIEPVLIDPGAPAARSGPWMANSARGSEPRVWAKGEFLLWWTKNAPVNTPLATQAATITPPAGTVGDANTTVVLGDRNYDLGTRFGGRFTLGGWFDCEGLFGLEGNYFFIASGSKSSSVGSSGEPGSPTIFLPFRDPFNGNPAAVGLATGAIPGFPVPGTATLRVENSLQGAEANFLGRLWRTECVSVTGLAGFRYLRFEENLDFTATAQAPVTGAQFTALDSFHATNNFYGGNLGLRGEYRYGNFVIGATGKVALGTMRQTVEIAGASSSIGPANPGSPVSGFYAQPTNSGSHSQNVFAVIPEAEIKLGYNITRNIQGFVGYNFLYINNVARPGASIDPNVNPTQVTALGGAPGALVGPAAPSFSFNRSDFWAHGLNFGIQFTY